MTSTNTTKTTTVAVADLTVGNVVKTKEGVRRWVRIVRIGPVEHGDFREGSRIADVELVNGKKAGKVYVMRLHHYTDGWEVQPASITTDPQDDADNPKLFCTVCHIHKNCHTPALPGYENHPRVCDLSRDELTLEGMKPPAPRVPRNTDNPKVHVFDSTGAAYNASQCHEDINDGDVLSVPSMGVVAVLVAAWPTAVDLSADDDRAGEFHTLKPGEEWGALEFGDYTKSVALAREVLATFATTANLTVTYIGEDDVADSLDVPAGLIALVGQDAARQLVDRLDGQLANPTPVPGEILVRAEDVAACGAVYPLATRTDGTPFVCDLDPNHGDTGHEAPEGDGKSRVTWDGPAPSAITANTRKAPKLVPGTPRPAFEDARQITDAGKAWVVTNERTAGEFRPERTHTAIVGDAALMSTLAGYGVPGWYAEHGHTSKDQPHEYRNSLVSVTWVWKRPHVAEQRHALLTELKALIGVSHWQAAYDLVTSRGPELGRTERWKNACAWFVDQHNDGRPLDWIVTQGAIFLGHANAR